MIKKKDFLEKSMFFIILILSSYFLYSFTATGSNIFVKRTTLGLQGSNVDSLSTNARILLTVFQPGALAFGTNTKVNIGFFELFDVCEPSGECGLFLGTILYCDEGTWKDPDLSKDYCTAEGCEFVWMDGVSDGTQCCGDDNQDDDSYYYNDSLTTAKNVRCERCLDGSFVTNVTLIGNGVLVGTGQERVCYYGDILCDVYNAKNGSNATVYGWGYVDNQTCFYGDASCSDGSYSNSTSCTLACPNGWTWCCINESTYVNNVLCNETSGCQETEHDRDESQAYCEESTRDCINYTWFSNVNKCCGDDLNNDNFEDPGANNDCCFNGTVIKHNSSYNFMLCWNGELYDCNNNVDLGFETDVANCEEADSSGWFCDADGDPAYWQRGLPLGCAGCDYNSDCYDGYCDAEDGTSEPLYGLDIDVHVCFNCSECLESPGNFVCSSSNTSRCEYDCVGSGAEDCDDVQPKSCRLNSDIYCDYGCLSHDRDEDEVYCTTNNTNCEPLHWIKGGEKSSFGEYAIGNETECCGDDPGEFFVNSSLNGYYYAACCDDSSDCVNSSHLCVDSGSIQGDFICVNSYWDHLPQQDNPRLFIHARIKDYLIGYWTLDDDVKDYSLYNHDGINNGAINTLQGYSGGAFIFDGNDYIDLPNNLGYNSIVSVFAWVKITGSVPNNYYVVIGGPELEISITSTGNLKTGLVTSDGQFIDEYTSSLTDGNWHFIGFTFNGSVKKSYVDGTLVGSQSVTGSLVSSFNYRRIGRLGSQNEYMNGLIDEVMIFNKTLSDKEVYELYNGIAYTKNDLVCTPVNVTDTDDTNLTYIVNWYFDGSSIVSLNMPFDSNVSSVSVGKIRDYSIYDNNGTLGGGNTNNAPKYIVSNCISGGCYKFDGNDYVNIPNDPVGNNDSVSFEVWVYPMSNNGNDQYVLSTGGQADSVGYAIIWKDGQFRVVRKTETMSFDSGYIGSYSLDNWYHVVGVYNDKQNMLYVYVNGELKGSFEGVSGSYTNIYSSLTIGKPNNVDNYYFNGIIDEVKIYDIALTTGQIKKDYISGSGHHQNFILDDSMTTKHHNYKCDLIVNDGYGDSLRKLSNEISVQNTPPTKPLLKEPINGDILTNRRPLFSWFASEDDDNDSITYNLDIIFKECNTVDTQYCTGTNIKESSLSSTEYTPISDLDIADYEWNVSAYDGENISESSNKFNFSIEPLINISLINDLVSFGTLEVGKSYNTTNNNPEPFSIRNNGNVYVDIKVNASKLFESASLNTDTFRIKARNLEQGSINESGSALDWINLSNVLKKVIADLNFHDSSDEAYLDIYVRVPQDEPQGTKTSTLTFVGEMS